MMLLLRKSRRRNRVILMMNFLMKELAKRMNRTSGTSNTSWRAFESIMMMFINLQLSEYKFIIYKMQVVFLTLCTVGLHCYWISWIFHLGNRFPKSWGRIFPCMSAISECEQLPLSSTKLPGLKKNVFWNSMLRGFLSYRLHGHFWTLVIHLDCSQDSVYGRRDGALTGLAVVHRDKGNPFPTTKGFRLGVVHDVAMLPRAMMYKPHASYMQNLFPHMQMWD